MPFYDYACQACGHRIEVMHGVNDLGPGACGRCGGPMRKLLSTPAIVFKGSGWAKKDARAEQPGTASKATGDGEASPSPKVTTQTEGPSKTESASTGRSAEPKSTGTTGGSGATDSGS